MIIWNEVINMKQEPISKALVFTNKQIAATIAAAPDRVIDPECLYDPNDAKSVTVRYSPDVNAYFKATGDGWQTRMNAALQDYVALQSKTVF